MKPSANNIAYLYRALVSLIGLLRLGSEPRTKVCLLLQIVLDTLSGESFPRNSNWSDSNISSSTFSFSCQLPIRADHLPSNCHLDSQTRKVRKRCLITLNRAISHHHKLARFEPFTRFCWLEQFWEVLIWP